MIRLLIDDGCLLTPHEANGIAMLLEQMTESGGSSLAAKVNEGLRESVDSSLAYDIVMSDEETRSLFRAIKDLPGEKVSENLVALQASLAAHMGG